MLLSALPLFTTNSFYLGVVEIVCIYAVLAMAWDGFSGLTGYLNFGIAFSFGVGGYVSAFLSTAYNVPPVLGLMAAGAGSAFFSLIVGAPSLRLRGHFFILVSLLVPLAASSLLAYLITEDGSIFNVNQLVNNSFFIYNAAVLLFSATAIILLIVVNSKLGLLFKAIRENEIAAEASGLKTGRYKILAFTISSVFAGLAGGIYVYSNGVASPTIFGLGFSALPVMMAALGGMGTIVGPILGAFILQGLIDLLRINVVQDARLLIASALLFVTLVFSPAGIWGIISARLRRRKN